MHLLKGFGGKIEIILDICVIRVAKLTNPGATKRAVHQSEKVGRCTRYYSPTEATLSDVSPGRMDEAHSCEISTDVSRPWVYTLHPCPSVDHELLKQRTHLVYHEIHDLLKSNLRKASAPL